MSNNLSYLDQEHGTKTVFHNFGELNKVPRPSKNEGKVLAYLENWVIEKNKMRADNDKIELIKDKHEGETSYNIILRKKATKGMEDRQSVCLQGHIDMVCVSDNTKPNYDFDNLPIESYVDGDWIKAKGTTLGADDGIAIAMGLAIFESTDIPHPALEMLCTWDEESGMTGAAKLGTGLFNSKIFVNIDSEKEGVFTIGCAGGINTDAQYKYEADAVPANTKPYKVAVSGLLGGHSGIEIHAGHANASKILTRVLWDAAEKFDIRLSTFDGGVKHNAIPSSAAAIIVVPEANTAAFEAYMVAIENTVKKEFEVVEKDLAIKAEVMSEIPYRVCSKEFQFKLIASFYAVPHGVLRMSPNPGTKGLVQSSTNFAIVETREDSIYALTSQRSSVASEKINIMNKVRASFMLGGAAVSSTDGYPAWEPNASSAILKLAESVYEKKFNNKPVIETIHAGLECGLIGEKYSGLDMLSIGPNLEAVHSPAEKLQISSTQKVWDFLLELLKAIPVK